MVRARSLPLPLLAAWLLAVSAAHGAPAGRMGRQISDIPGMPVGMTDVAQDATGYLWISSGSGLSRYDGFEVRSWGEVPGRLTYVATGPGGEVLAGDARTGLFEVDGPRLRRVPPPAGVDAEGPRHAAYDVRGTLWVAWSGRALRRENGAWHEADDARIVEDVAFSLAPRADGGVLLGSISGDVWAIEADGAARPLARDLGGWIMQLHDGPLGPVATVRGGDRPGFVRIRDDGVEHLLEGGTRSDGLARRGAAYWVAYPTGIWIVGDDGSREFLSAKQGFAGFGNIATDREGGLWVAGVQGLSHYPQPETRVWTESTGLPRTYLRGVHAVPGGYLVTSWRGPMFVDPDGNARDVELGDRYSRDIGCPDPWGGVWLKTLPMPEDGREVNVRRPTRASVVHWRGGRARVALDHPAFYRGDLACDAGPHGSFWLLADAEVLEIADPTATPRVRGRLPAAWSVERIQTALAVRDDARSVTAVFYDQTCEAALPAPPTPIEPADWSCVPTTDGDGGALDVIETPHGRLWLARDDGGVFEWSGSAWNRVPGDLSEMHEALALEPAAAGGVWVVGWRERWRVEERSAGKPPAVVERLTRAQGVPDWQNGYGLLEEPDGTVWLPLYSGLVRVPPSARNQPAAAPTVTLTSLVADGRQVPPAETLELRHGDHSLEIRWSALSFRDPTSVRYRMRLDAEPRWSTLSQPFVRLANLTAGSHRVELSASLDGETWSERPALVRFRVRQAWYRQGWFLLLLVVAGATVLYVGFRLRLAYLLRLERQRTRIAMDLHDEMGAGLGSAGLLVGLLRDDGLDPAERRSIGERAVEQIRDLGASLSDIVWSLRPGTETLDALLLFLRQRAADLFPPAGAVRVSFDAPDPCPRLRLSLPQRRNLQWIAVEALHNAARHARARRVVVRLRPESNAWVLSIRDDGMGIAENDAQSSGLGRTSMQRRADQIGATLNVRSEPQAGTEVSLRFEPGRSRS